MEAGDVTQLLADYQAGDRRCLDQVFSLLYGELKRVAAGHMRRERNAATIQPTALVNEVYCRLAADKALDANSRRDFFAIAVTAMRRILVDSARKRLAAKRDGVKVPLDTVIADRLPDDQETLALNEVLAAFAEAHPRPARIVEMRYFGGFEIDEIASLLEISPATVKRDWSFARAWLHRELTPKAE